jgi:hypothetical protein
MWSNLFMKEKIKFKSNYMQDCWSWFIVAITRSDLKNKVQDSNCIISLMLYDIKLWKKKLQSYELTFFMGDKLKLWTYDDDDE